MIHSLTSVYVMILCVDQFVDGCVSKYFLGGSRNIFASPGNCTFRPILHWYTTCTAKRDRNPAKMRPTSLRGFLGLHE